MELIDYIVLGIIALVIGGAVAYIIKAKKSGKKCIGCPDSGACASASKCGGACSSCCNCHTDADSRNESSN